MNAAYIISATTITHVWTALGGDPPKRGRARAFYRNGDNAQAVSLDDAKGCWFDHRDGVGGGVLDMIQRILGCDRGRAMRWLSSFTGIPLEDRSFTGAERRALAERREREQREMRAAECFRIAAASMAEHVLDELPEAVPERYGPTQFLLCLRAAHGTDLLPLYRDYCEREPRLTAAFVYSGAQAWKRLCDRLARFIVDADVVSNAV